jgi:hypothetical protein
MNDSQMPKMENLSFQIDFSLGLRKMKGEGIL